MRIILQCNRRWREQIDAVITKARCRLDILRSMSKRLGRKSLEKLYLTYIGPVVEYGGIVSSTVPVTVPWKKGRDWKTYNAIWLE